MIGDSHYQNSDTKAKPDKNFRGRFVTNWGHWLGKLFAKSYYVVRDKHEIENEIVSIILALFGKTLLSGI